MFEWYILTKSSNGSDFERMFLKMLYEIVKIYKSNNLKFFRKVLGREVLTNFRERGGKIGWESP
jgi:hypothetical protein